jgi:copper homeostasis protein
VPLVEAAVESIADLLLAQDSGAARVELCGHLADGGTTPSAGTIRAAARRARIPVFVLVRPRRGDFLYDAADIEIMLRDIEHAKAEGIQGIVSGALHANCTIDQDGTTALLEAAAPLPFTFHRAFDMTRDLREALDVLMSIGVTRILTSGGAQDAVRGVDMLRQLVARAGSHLTIVAGGGIRGENARAVATRSGVREIHLGPRVIRESGMRAAPDAPRIAKSEPISEGAWSQLDAAEVARVVTLVGGE